MRIAMTGLRAIGPGSSGGVERAVEELSTRLAARGHEVTVFCRRRYNVEGLTTYKGVRLCNLPAVYTKHLEAITHTALAALRSMAGYDVVHIHALGPSLLGFLPRLSGRRVVVTVHAQDWKREKWGGVARQALRLGERTSLTFPHRTIVVSRTLRRHFRERYGRDTVYIPNGITEPNRRPLDKLSRFGVAGGDYVLYLGRLVPEKGCHLLIRAFRELATDARLLVVGGTSHTDTYVNELRTLAGDDDRIVFTGPLVGEEKDEAYSNAMGLAFPSTLEGMPIVMLEALSYGCPVLCSDIPENIDLLQGHGPPSADRTDLARFVRVFPGHDVAALREELGLLLSDPEGARQRAHGAADAVRTAYSWEHVTDETESVYQDLCSSTAEQGGGVPS